MTIPQVILLLVGLQRLGELLYARRNTRRLLAEGGLEIGAGHYPLFVVLHAAWLITLFLRTDGDTPVIWSYALPSFGGRIFAQRTRHRSCAG